MSLCSLGTGHQRAASKRGRSALRAVRPGGADCFAARARKPLDRAKAAGWASQLRLRARRTVVSSRAQLPCGLCRSRVRAVVSCRAKLASRRPGVAKVTRTTNGLGGCVRTKGPGGTDILRSRTNRAVISSIACSFHRRSGAEEARGAIQLRSRCHTAKGARRARNASNHRSSSRRRTVCARGAVLARGACSLARR